MSQLIPLTPPAHQYAAAELQQIQAALQDNGIAFQITQQQILVIKNKLEQAQQIVDEIRSNFLHHEIHMVAMHNMLWAMLRGLFPG